MILLKGQDLQDTLNVIRDSLGLIVGSDYVNGLLSASIMMEVIDCGAQDSLTRALICDTIAQDLIGQDVPTYGDGPEVVENFWQELYEAARIRNIRVVSDTSG